MQTKRIAVIPGDGIGLDVTAEAVKVLEAVAGQEGLSLETTEYDWGAEEYLQTGVGMPEGGMDEMRTYDAVFLGALGDPRVPDMAHAAEILLGMRFQLDLFVNHRPVELLDARLTPLKDRTEEDVRFVVLRENTEGLYVGMGGQFKRNTPHEVAIQEDVNTRHGVERIVRHAFELAMKRPRRHLTMCDKSNALTYGHDLWVRVFEEVGAEYPDVKTSHLYVDALCMQMVKRPQQFDVIVTCNMFGDIISDLGAQLQGGLGLAASGNIHPGRTSLFEPVHGSAPKYAGKDVANPLGAILSAALMLEHLGHEAAARRVHEAVARVVRAGQGPREIGGDLGTRATGDAVVVALDAA